MWNGILKSKTSENGQLKITVTYVKKGDEASSFDEIYTLGELPDDNWLSTTVADKTAQLNALEDFSSTLQEGQIVPPPPVPEATPVEPTPVEDQQVEGPVVTETPQPASTEGAPANG